MTITIVPYREDWPHAFAAFAEALRNAIPVGAWLDHIGSTAVPGLAAKDVIDMQLTVDRLQDVDAAALDRCGFVERSVRNDHCPAGFDLPRAELAKRFFNGRTRAANLHVRERHRFNQRYALVCRDYLRSHPAAASAYARVKRRLAQHFPEDAEAYYDIKDPVFDVLMAGAEDWAASVGWRASATI